MGWLPQSKFDGLKSAALALSPAERAALTWESAGRFVAADTVDMAIWRGLRDTGMTPWEAVAELRCFNPEAPATEQPAQAQPR